MAHVFVKHGRIAQRCILWYAQSEKMEGEMIMRPRATDFRAAARNSLRGYWGWALLVCLVAGILGGIPASSGVVNVTTAIKDNFYYSIPWYGAWAILRTGLASLLSMWGVITFLIGGAVQLGLYEFHTRLSMGERPPLSVLFGKFQIFLKALGLRLFMLLFIVLWSLLLVVPGIIAAYRYAMAPYLMAEYPQMGIREAVDRSKQMMHGHKGRLFCLGFSFIGWWLLSILTFGILSLWITPYVETAKAAFYLDLTGRQFGFSGAGAQ